MSTYITNIRFHTTLLVAEDGSTARTKPVLQYQDNKADRWYDVHDYSYDHREVILPSLITEAKKK